VAPELRVRYNYPYRGNTDGLGTWLRNRHPASRYLGIEIEINQRLVVTGGWRSFQDSIATSLGELMYSS
jgi:hypothetical protein